MSGTGIVVGCYVRPAGHTGDPDHRHRDEGTVWAIERLPDPETGELVDHVHIVRDGALGAHGGIGLHWTILPADQVDEIGPADGATVDRLIRLAGRDLHQRGRKADKRLFALVHALRAVIADDAPRPRMPSVFGDGDEEIEGPPLRQPGVTSDQDRVDITARLWGRFLQLDHAYQAELRRTARVNRLAYLDGDVVLSLGDVIAYDAALRRWERLQAQRDTQPADGAAVTA